MSVRNANILDPSHDTLDSRVWDKAGSARPSLKPKHAHWIKSRVYSVLDQAGYTNPEDWLTLVVTGSLTTYQYSDDSDFDISLFVDSKVFPEWSRAEMIGLMVSQLDDHPVPGTPFPLQVYVVPEGIKPHDIYRPGLRSGYNLDNNKWIVPPEKDRVQDVEATQNGFYSWALQVADKMERLIRYEPHKADDYLQSIHDRRKRDMQKGKGDYSESNIVYKFLAQRGLIPKGGKYTARVSTYPMGNQNYWHVSPRENREKILEQGLQGQQQHLHDDSPWKYTWDQPAGNYMFDDLDNARAYVHNLHQQVSTPPKVKDWISDPTPIQPDYEERYEEPEHPANWEDMSDEEQDAWYDENSYKERSEDPKGYDIWNVQGHGLPMFPDPEVMMVRRNRQPWDLGNIHDELQKADEDISHWEGTPESAALNHRERENQFGIEHGTTQQRLVSPTPVPPHRLKVEEHHPRWNLTPEGHEEANLVGAGDVYEENEENEYPEPWARIPFTELPIPGHESKKAGIAQYAELVPTETLAPYREFHRRPGEANSFELEGYYDALKDHIAKNGFEDPITLEYNPDKGTAIIGEGNHRLNVAEDLGLSHVPVHIMRAYTDRAVAPIETRIKPDQYGYFPSNLKPSEFGLPTAGPYQEAKSDWYEEHPQFFSKVEKSASSLHDLIDTIFNGVLAGGITINLAGEMPQTRYGFAPDKASEEKVPLNEVTPQHVEEYIASHLKELGEPGKYIGAWIQDGFVWFDVTEGHDDYNEAFERAWKGHQQAMYDGVTDESIPVRGYDYYPSPQSESKLTAWRTLRGEDA